MATLRRLCLLAVLLLVSGPVPAGAQASPEFRAVWIDNFNSRLASAEDVRTVVSRAAAMHANVLLVQVRRRGDAWYLDSGEPLGDGVPSGFDPLAEVLAQARPLGLEVHAFLTLGAVWNQGTAPPAAEHVFNRHGLGTGGALPGRENWLTRTTAPDGGTTSFDGYRFGNDFWLDPAHPDVAAYLTDLVVRLVRRYPVDGVHLDRVQYPEVPGATGTLATSVGYNPTALQRYNERYGATGQPAPDDPRFAEWRREQVTNLVQRLYVSAVAERPSLVVSIAVSAAGSAPGDFRATEPFARAFQDWQAWLAGGSVDLVVPQVFRPAHTAAGAEEFLAWVRWTHASQGRRSAVIGLGAYLNAVEGIVHQVRRTRAAGTPAIDEGSSAAAEYSPLAGVALFSLAANNAPVVDNPLSVPAGRDTPLRAVEDVAAGLRSGRTTSGQAVDTAASGPFAEAVGVPALPWKAIEGHILGQVLDASGRPVDGATVRAMQGDTAAPALAVTDGTGTFALPGLAPGTYRLTATLGASAYVTTCDIEVTATSVTRLALGLDRGRPGVLDCR